MTDWDERFESGKYPQEPEPSGLLQRYVDALPTGRALDVATGTGRNAVFLADRGHRVDALDKSRAGLEITRDRAAARGSTTGSNSCRPTFRRTSSRPTRTTS